MFKVVRVSEFDTRELNSVYKNMTPDRQARVDKLKFQEDKLKTLVGEKLAKELVSMYCNIPLEQVSIYIGNNGKPYVAGLSTYFNISHSGDYVACVVSSNPVGIDIEIDSEVNLAVAKKVFSQTELDFVLDSGISSEESKSRLLQIWTYKEAFIKMKGWGLKGLDSVPDFFASSKEILITPEYTLCITEEK